MNYLVVCRNNVVRSPAAAKYMQSLLQEKGRSGIVTAAGVSECAPRRVSQELVDCARVIFCMDASIGGVVREAYPEAREKVVELDVLDVYMSGGEFSRVNLLRVLRGMDVDKQLVIANRPEFRDALSLEEVLRMHRAVFEQYL